MIVQLRHLRVDPSVGAIGTGRQGGGEFLNLFVHLARVLLKLGDFSVILFGRLVAPETVVKSSPLILPSRTVAASLPASPALASFWPSPASFAAVRS